MCYVLIIISFGMAYGAMAARLGIILHEKATSISRAVTTPVDPYGDSPREEFFCQCLSE